MHLSICFARTIQLFRTIHQYPGIQMHWHGTCATFESIWLIRCAVRRRLRCLETNTSSWKKSPTCFRRSRSVREWLGLATKRSLGSQLRLRFVRFFRRSSCNFNCWGFHESSSTSRAVFGGRWSGRGTCTRAIYENCMRHHDNSWAFFDVSFLPAFLVGD